MRQDPVPPVSLFRLFNRMGGWLVIVLGVTLLLFTLVSALSFNIADRFDEDGKPARAAVSDRYTTVSTDSDGDRTTTYWLTFNFETQDGREITLTESVGSGLYNRVGEGERFDLLYLASNPEEVETSPGSNRRASRFTQGAALVLGLIWLAGLWLVGGWAVAAVRARRYGTREAVRITEVARTNVRINNRPRYRLHWTDSKGRPGKSLLQKWNRVKHMSVGDEIDIYRGVKTGWWVGDVGERPPG